MEKVALVTGASRGIGAAIAKVLASDYRVIVNYKSSEKLAEEVVNEIREAGGEAESFQADVSKEEDVVKLFKYIKTIYRRIDVLVNNAGVTADNFLMSMNLDNWNKVINSYLTSVFLCCREASKIMHYFKIPGRIVNIASVSGLIGLEGQANYSAAKGGVIALTKAVAKELVADKVVVNCVAPGFIESDMTKAVNQKLVQKMLENVSVKRYGTALEVAKFVQFLCSDDVEYITGKVFTIDGGMVY